VRQQGARGLGHAVWCARDIIGDEPFAVLLPDMLIQAKPSCLAQMVEAYNRVGGNIVAVDAIPHEQVSSYGVIAHGPEKDGVLPLTGMVEKPPVNEAPSNLKITGRYILQPEIFRYLETQKQGAGGEIQLTDAMLTMMGEQAFHAVAYDGQDYDCGSKVGYAQAYLAYALADATDGPAVRAMVEALLKD
jgi:UTP--glucose-1-phosphate uridylyltransferase